MSQGGDSVPRMLVWMDLEMTGLDPARHVIVEIATIVTDDQLQIVAEGPDLVVHQPPAAMAEMEEVVRTMHTTSKPLPAIATSTVDRKSVGWGKSVSWRGVHEGRRV